MLQKSVSGIPIPMKLGSSMTLDEILNVESMVSIVKEDKGKDHSRTFVVSSSAMTSPE